MRIYQTYSKPPVRWFRSIGRGVYSAFWFLALPAALAGAFVLLGVEPVPSGSKEDQHRLAALLNNHSWVLGIALFLLFTALLRYWRFYLPGRAWQSPLPTRLAGKIRAERHRRLVEPAQTARFLLRPETWKRARRELAPVEFRRCKASVLQLLRALRAQDEPAVAVHHAALTSALMPLLKRQRAFENGVFAAALGLALAGAWTIRASVLGSYTVLSGSMLPGFQPDDQLAAFKAAYGFTLPWASHRPNVRIPDRGDIVIFENRGLDLRGADRLVKRVIGVPGDTVEVTGGFVKINDWRVPSCAVGTYAYLGPLGRARGLVLVEWLGDHAYLTLRARRFEAPYRVKPGEVFVLGDNRNNSRDSGSWHKGEGTGVPLSQIEGRVERVLVGKKRSGANAWQRLFEPIGTELHLEGVDLGEVQARIDVCLKTPPARTLPPLQPPPLSATGKSAS